MEHLSEVGIGPLSPLPAAPRNTDGVLCQVQASGMKVALKNSVDLLYDLVDCFDFAVNESCNVWNECNVSVCKLSQSFDLRPRAAVAFCQGQADCLIFAY